MKKLWILCFLGVALIESVAGQSLSQFKTRLATPDPNYHSTVVATEHGEAATAVQTARASLSGSKMRGYRILIFSANTQNARSEAEATMTRFKELYPTVPVNMVYELPNFKVMVGYFLTSEEALVLWGKIKGEFDRALVIRADITLDDLEKSSLPQEPLPDDGQIKAEKTGK